MENSTFKKKLIRKGIIAGVYTLIVVGVCVAIPLVNKNVITPNSGFITSALCSVETDEESSSKASRAGAKLAVEIEQEGIVLAKNDNKTLPFSKDLNKVNVFGHAVVDWLVSNSGSGSSGPGSSQKTIGLLDALKENGIEYNTDIIDFYKS